MNNLKKILPILLIGIMTLTSFTEEGESVWLTNYEEALALSKKENKSILMSFSGSDWCANCMRLEKVVFSSEAFKKYATENFVLLNLDYPAKKKNRLSPEMTKQNDELAEKYNKTGTFPTVLILSSEEKVLGTTGYKKISAEAYVSHLKSLVK